MSTMLRLMLLGLLAGACVDPVVIIERVRPGNDGEGEGESGEGEGDILAEGEGEGEGEVITDVTLVHPRELRGAWIATVYGIDFPQNTSDNAASKQTELRNLVNDLADVGINAIFFQVRPESDALYASTIEPTSRFLSGASGRDPGFDALSVVLDEAHRRHVAVHAWLNPYRAATSSSDTFASNHVTNTLTDDIVTTGNQLWLNPASPAVQQHVLSVIDDIVNRYPIDGIHFDDYFYPYPIDGEPFDDASSFNAYRNAGGTAALGEWRRANVNALVSSVHDLLIMNHPEMQFGISPFGIYRPGIPAGIVGLDAYEEISCDPLFWIDNDWVDYLAPQLYWPTTQTAQSFTTLLPFWASATDNDGRFIVAGINTAGDFGTGEYENQYAVTNDNRDVGARGYIHYHAGALLADSALSSLTSARASLALPPAKPQAPSPAALAPTLSASTLTMPGDDRTQFVVYAEQGSAFFVAALLYGGESYTAAAGRLAVTTMSAAGVESAPVVVVVP
jgi:uncharacterized lipoprotein YddW (UPF0748 family)